MKRLTVERQSRKWSKHQLARLANIHPTRLGQIELGRAIPPDDSVELKRIAKALGWTERPVLLLEEVED